MIFNPFKPHKVQFDNNKYGIRVLTLFGWEYLDFKTPGCWWGKNKYSFEDCIVNTLDEVNNKYLFIEEKVIK